MTIRWASLRVATPVESQPCCLPRPAPIGCPGPGLRTLFHLPCFPITAPRAGAGGGGARIIGMGRKAAEGVLQGVLDVLLPDLETRTESVHIGRDTGAEEFPVHAAAFQKFGQIKSFISVLDGDKRGSRAAEKLSEHAASDSVFFFPPRCRKPGCGRRCSDSPLMKPKPWVSAETNSQQSWVNWTPSTIRHQIRLSRSPKPSCANWLTPWAELNRISPVWGRQGSRALFSLSHWWRT